LACQYEVTEDVVIERPWPTCVPVLRVAEL